MNNNSTVTFALAQISVVKGEIAQNLLVHKKAIELAANNGADIVVFPELSLTGYEPTLASKLAINEQSEIVNALSCISQENRVVIILGCPLKSEELRPFIGSIISYPSGQTEFYCKQYLHTGESDYFIAGKGDYFLNYKAHKIALSICADFSNPIHAKKAKDENANVYLASVLISDNGFILDSQQLQAYALTHKFPVLMANHNSETGGWKTCGKSRAWNNTGQLAVAVDNNDNALIICTVFNGQVSGHVIKI